MTPAGFAMVAVFAVAVGLWTPTLVHWLSRHRSPAALAADRWHRSMAQDVDAALARAEDRYVHDDLDLAGLEREVETILGIRNLEHERRVQIAREESERRAARSLIPIVLPKPEPPHPFLWTTSVAGSAVGVTPHVVHPATLEPVECHELVDATGKVIARYPKHQSYLLPGA